MSHGAMLWMGAWLTAWFWLVLTGGLPTATPSLRPAVPVTREQCERVGGDWLTSVDVGRCVGADK